MSHLPEQPHEVPFREVEHDEPYDVDGWPWEAGRYAVGTVRDWDFWGTTTDDRKVRSELLERDRARAALGGFGFRSAAA